MRTQESISLWFIFEQNQVHQIVSKLSFPSGIDVFLVGAFLKKRARLLQSLVFSRRFYK